MKLDDLFVYCKDTHSVFILKDGVKFRKLIPDEDNNVNIVVKGFRVRMKYAVLVYSLVHKRRLQSHETIFHKDLDESNNTVHNLVCVPKKDKARIKEALKNLSGALRLIPHPTDLYSYVVEYRHEGRLKREVHEDVVPAKRRLAKLQIQFIKFLGKYVVSN